MATKLTDLEVYDKEGDVRTIIETPRGHRNKYTYDPDLELFSLSGVMPAGAVFPFDFGFVPSTLGEDGDPLDILVLMDEAAYPGLLIPARLIGILEAQQISEKENDRNDRVIAVHSKSRLFKDVEDIKDIPTTITEEITNFFTNYNEQNGVEFKPLGMRGKSEAKKMLLESMERYKSKA